MSNIKKGKSKNGQKVLAEQANAHIHKKEYDLAEAKFKEILEQDPADSEAYNNLGVIELFRTNKLDEFKDKSKMTKLTQNAYNYFKQALYYDDENCSALINMAGLHVLNMPEEARKYYERALIACPRGALDYIYAQIDRIDNKLQTPVLTDNTEAFFEQEILGSNKNFTDNSY